MLGNGTAVEFGDLAGDDATRSEPRGRSVGDPLQDLVTDRSGDQRRHRFVVAYVDREAAQFASAM